MNIIFRILFFYSDKAAVFLSAFISCNIFGFEVLNTSVYESIITNLVEEIEQRIR